MDHVFEEFGELLSPEDAAKFLGGLTIRTLSTWRAEGTGPAYIMVGGQVKYPYNRLREWLLANEVQPKEDGR